jgi:uncharacterized membrane protein
MENASALITNDAIVFGILALILGGVFWTSSFERGFFKIFYRFVPPLLLCYFVPSLFTTFGLFDPEGSNIYFVASRYLLPAALVLLTLSADLPATFRLGPKALIMFFTGTIGVMIGGPLALMVASMIDPGLIDGADSPAAVWRGMATVAGSWIGGGANQTAIFEIFEVDASVFSAWIAVDVIVANLWMAILLYVAANPSAIDKRLKSDVSAIDHLRVKAEEFEQKTARPPQLTDLMYILAIGFGAVALAHIVADNLAPWIGETYPGLDRYSLTSGFFWLIVVATTLGVILSFTPLRNLQAAGAMRIGRVFIYILVASIGMRMDITAIFDNPEYFLIGLFWVAIHAVLLIAVAVLIRAPMFFLAVGSQANIGGAASAPVVAAAFHPALAPVGVLLAVLGYIVGTYGAYITGLIMQAISGG